MPKATKAHRAKLDKLNANSPHVPFAERLPDTYNGFEVIDGESQLLDAMREAMAAKRERFFSGIDPRQPWSDTSGELD